MSLTPDEAGFTAFVTARGPSLQRAAFLLTGDHHLAQDLVQGALMQAAKHWTKIHTSPEAYVRRSIFTANVSSWRRRKNLTEHPAGDALPQRPADDGDHDARLSLAAALDALTRKQRAVLVLRYWSDLTETQAAETLGVSVNTVKSTHRQALARLRERSPELVDLMGGHR
ncbi:SigE family RNA polymerase sigma factor [Nocardioides yefusunii]|uniref:SigE family RNA polymerase sigma factor n=1 Tax=Nocardioides yefusunii TaxID=2500546 RepID=A0ABW1QZW2_9ACTN|nr:SigE family RNA polymerase sigma factor [Nocardioides yefusunii]